MLEYRRPRVATIFGFPHATCCSSDVHHIRVTQHDVDVIDTAAHACRADIPRLDVVEHGHVDFLGGECACCEKGDEGGKVESGFHGG